MNSQKKVLSQTDLKKVIARLRKQKKTIAFTNGCFDILHFGHVSYLETAKKVNRVLIVALNSDRSIRVIKGRNRPILPQKERAALIAALACVDYVTIFDEPTPANIILDLKPDILVKGADWKGKQIAGARTVQDYGGRVEFIRYLRGFSTTQIITKILHKCQQ